MLDYIFPEVIRLQGVEQSPPHRLDVWGHTLKVLDYLTGVIDLLSLPFNPDAAENLALGQVTLRLGRFREGIDAHLREHFNPDHTRRDLLFLAALYHDVGKPATRQVDEQGRARFLGHDQAGAEIVQERLTALHFSKEEIDWTAKVVRHHLRPILLAQAGAQPSRRAVYRFFRNTGDAGVDVCLLSLADVLGTYGPTLPRRSVGRAA